MDWARSCYKSPVVFRVGDDALQVQWYFASENANAFPLFHAFGSLNWLGNGWTGTDIGEQPGPRPWQNGAAPINSGAGDLFAQQCAELLHTAWQSGLADGQETGPYNDLGQPLCCVDGPPPIPCDDCTFIPEVDMSVVFECPDCPCLDGTTWTLTFNAFPGNWTANGLELCADCPTPNVGIIVVSRILASAPCSLLLEGGQLFCFDLGGVEAEAVCDGNGNFLRCEWNGTISSGIAVCDGAAFKVTMTTL